MTRRATTSCPIGTGRALLGPSIIRGDGVPRTLTRATLVHGALSGSTVARGGFEARSQQGGLGAGPMRPGWHGLTLAHELIDTQRRKHAACRQRATYAAETCACVCRKGTPKRPRSGI